MGTDIHMFCEVNKDGKWQFAEPEGAVCNECKGTGTLVYGPEAMPQYRGQSHRCYWCHGKGKLKTYDNRSYRVFAVLAGVRNGTGFAGVKTGESVVPIAEPRGFPEDLSKKGKAWLKKNGGDHSDSWLTLAEIDTYMANTPENRKFTGIIGFSQLPDFLENGGPPATWCGGVGGPGVMVYDLAVAKHMIENDPSLAAPTEVFGHKNYVQVEWHEPFKDSLDSGFFRYLDSLRPLAEDPANIRLIFNFDS